MTLARTSPRSVRGSAPRAALALLPLLLPLLLVPLRATSAATEHYVSPTGSDAGHGSLADPWGTLAHALTQVGPGDTLWVRGGTYLERVRSPELQPGTATAPVTVSAYPGERPVVQGLLWLRDADHWILDGINVTWDAATGAANEHMVKLTDGVGWTFRNAEIWGARSHAGMLVAGTVAGLPADWSVTDNCIHDTYPANDRNQDHNLYVNNGLGSGPGLVARNLFYGASNGENIKLGGSSSTSGGASNVTIRHNTLANAAQNVLIAWSSHDNVLEGNLISGAEGNYANVRGYQLTGTGNVITASSGHDASALIWNDDQSTTGVVDAGDNAFPLDPRFDDTASCAGFRPTNPDAQAYGHLAPAADGGTTDGGTTDGSTDGTTDGTTDGATDGGSTDGGTDGGSTDGGSDGGSTDGGTGEVGPVAPLPTVHVSQLAGSGAWVTGKHWTATATATVADAAGAPVPGASVTGTWTGERIEVHTCTTGQDGTCAVVLERLKGTSVTFTVTAVTHDAYVHDPTADAATSVEVAVVSGGETTAPTKGGGPKRK